MQGDTDGVVRHGLGRDEQGHQGKLQLAVEADLVHIGINPFPFAGHLAGIKEGKAVVCGRPCAVVVVAVLFQVVGIGGVVHVHTQTGLVFERQRDAPLRFGEINGGNRATQESSLVQPAVNRGGAVVGGGFQLRAQTSSVAGLQRGGFFAPCGVKEAVVLRVAPFGQSQLVGQFGFKHGGKGGEIQSGLNHAFHHGFRAVAVVALGNHRAFCFGQIQGFGQRAGGKADFGSSALGGGNDFKRLQLLVKLYGGTDGGADFVGGIGKTGGGRQADVVAALVAAVDVHFQIARKFFQGGKAHAFHACAAQIGSFFADVVGVEIQRAGFDVRIIETFKVHLRGFKLFAGQAEKLADCRSVGERGVSACGQVFVFAQKDGVHR